MEKSSSKNKALYIFLSIFAVVAAGTASYFIWDYERIKKANATVVTIDDAKAMAEQALQ